MLNEDNITNEFIPKQTIKKYNKTKSEGLLNYSDYFKKKITLKDYKIPDLKIIAKQHGLHVSGTKPILIDRIQTHFNRTKTIIIIQACFRGWIVRYSIKLRGPAFNNRKLCVNDSDFVSMEPLLEIPNENFYSFTDSKDFVYGFNISSLIQLMKQTTRITNPYNREKIESETIDKIKTLYKLCFIIYPNFKDDNEELSKPKPVQQPSVRRNATMLTNSIQYENPEQQNRIERLQEFRRNSVSQRIHNLFSEIDRLGNYTQVSWFSSLNVAAYIRLFRNLYDIWYYRSQLTRETRKKICPLPAPFDTSVERNGARPLILEDVQTICVEVFENLVFMGSDDDHRKLGAFHALTALTIVSPEARTSLPWLYESVFMF
jgi:hypothetical protein